MRHGDTDAAAAAASAGTAVRQLSGLLARLVDVVDSIAGQSEARVALRLAGLRHDILLLSKTCAAA